jgi:hypothetical protein
MPTILSDVDFTTLPDSPPAPTPGAAELVANGYIDIDGSKWGTEGGLLRPYDGSRAGGMLLRPTTEAIRNVRVDVLLSDWGGPIILVARYVDAATFYRVEFRPDNFLAFRGTFGLGFVATWPALPAGPYRLRLEARDNPAGGTDLYCAVLTLDGSQVLQQGTLTGDAGGPQVAGRAGLDAFYGYATSITRVIVTDLDAAAPPPLAVALAPVTLGRGQPTRTQVFLTAPANATGTPPLTYRWHRQFSTEPPVDLGTDGTAQTDTPPDGRAYKYTLDTTDATGATVTSGPITAGVRDQNWYLLLVGDSTRYGDETVPPFNGLRDSEPSRMIPILAGLGNREWVDSTAPAADKAGRSVVQNLGKPTWNTALYLGLYPDDPAGRIWLDVHLDEADAARAAIDPDAQMAVSIRLGANDLAAGLSTAEYKANLATMAGKVTARGWPCLLDDPVPSVMGDRPAGHAAQIQAIDELIAAGAALPGDRTSYAVIARHWPDWYLPAGTGTDMIHPGPPAWQAMADATASAWDRAVLNPVAVPPPTSGDGGTGGTGGTSSFTLDQITAAVVAAVPTATDILDAIRSYHPTFRDLTDLTEGQVTVEDAWAAALVENDGPENTEAVSSTQARWIKKRKSGAPFRTFTLTLNAGGEPTARS